MKFNLNINVFESTQSETPIPLVLGDFESSDDLKEASDSVFTIIEHAADTDSCFGFQFFENDDIQISGHCDTKSNTCRIFFFKEVSGQPIFQMAGLFTIECLTHVKVVLFLRDEHDNLDCLVVDEVKILIDAIIKMTPLCYAKLIDAFQEKNIGAD